MDTLNILYIDDRPELQFERYMANYRNPHFEINFRERLFDANGGYDSLLTDGMVRSANIIFVDSRLFENQNASAGKFTGEEFQFVLKKFFPYIEVVVITQNGEEEGVHKIQKYQRSSGKSSEEYYAEIIPACIDKMVEAIIRYRTIANKLATNDTWEKVLREKVIATLNGTAEYDSLSKNDIDKLIDAFKVIQEKLDV